MNYKENYTSIPQYVLIYFHMQRFNFIDFMVIELHFFEKKKKLKNMNKCIFTYILQQAIFVYWLFFTHSSPSYRENEQYGFQWR